MRKETRCRHIGYSYRLTARVLLYAPSHRQDTTYHSLCYTSRGALAGTTNSSMGCETQFGGMSGRSWCGWSPDRTFVDDLFSYIARSRQPVLHDWCNKGRGMCYPVCGMVHIKEPLLLIGKSSLCGGSRFPFSQSEWSLTICLTPYNRR